MSNFKIFIIFILLGTVVQFLREKFNEYLDNADRLGARLKKTKCHDMLSTNIVFVDQARLMFERARELASEASVEEVVGNIAICERHYTGGMSAGHPHTHTLLLSLQ